jgi:5-formyltetrahydrofolate cyclo-ligase
MTSKPTNELKAELRKAVRAGRKLGFDCGEAHSMRLIELIVRNEFTTISAYEEFDNEPSLAGLREWCALNGVDVLLPVIAGETELTWHVDGVAASIADAQLIVMPALAAGRDGSRLGRGKGYYDRAVAGLNAPRLVVVHDEELYDSVPSEQFDQQVSAVVTCSEVLFVDGRLN